MAEKITVEFEHVPTLMYIEYDIEGVGKTFQVFQQGKLLENVNAIVLQHAPNLYQLDLDRDIGYEADLKEDQGE